MRQATSESSSDCFCSCSGHHYLPGLVPRAILVAIRLRPISLAASARPTGGLEWRARMDLNRRPPDSKSIGNRREPPSGTGSDRKALPGTTEETTTAFDASN